MTPSQTRVKRRVIFPARKIFSTVFFVHSLLAYDQMCNDWHASQDANEIEDLQGVNFNDNINSLQST